MIGSLSLQLVLNNLDTSLGLLFHMETFWKKSGKYVRK